MANNDQLVSTSTFLNLVLRRRPEEMDAMLEPEGWLCVDELIGQAIAQ